MCSSDLTDEANNIDYLVTMGHVSVYYVVSKQSVLIVDMLDVGEMGRPEDLSDFDKGQIVMARRLDLRSQCRLRLGFLYRKRSCLPVYARKRVVEGTLPSVLDYGNVVYRRVRQQPQTASVSYTAKLVLTGTIFSSKFPSKRIHSLVS